MNLGKNIKKLTSGFFVGLRITKGPSDKLGDIKIFPNAISASLTCTPNLQKRTLDWSIVHGTNSNYTVGKTSFFNFVTQEKICNILPTPVFPVLKKIIEPDIHKKIVIESPININVNQNIDLPTSIKKEMFDPLKNILKKEAKMSLVRIKRKQMRKHQYLKSLKRRKALLLRLRQRKIKKKEALFKAELQEILNTGLNFSAEKYVEEKLEKLDWRPPITKARGILAPDWVIREELQKKNFNTSMRRRANECAEKMKKKLL